MEEESNECHDHITSLAVLRTHRKLGLATKLMTAAHAAMEQVTQSFTFVFLIFVIEAVLYDFAVVQGSHEFMNSGFAAARISLS
ncbi:unnamed protein product [Arabis nemorensis]|uniref:N-acetyltransferase domain-containing protein n=1 Tax=Arabis nemorensis TaxID=586526 RepID=A0A565CCY3_9BRAS|nr:unnamed protein product [Arabis nemorensis]